MMKTEQDARPIPWRRILLSVILLVALTLMVRRERMDVPGAGMFAALLLVSSAAMLLRAAVKTGSFINEYTLVLGTFLLTYPLSAFVHLTGRGHIYPKVFMKLRPLIAIHKSIMCIYRLRSYLLAQLALWWGLAPRAPAIQPKVRTWSACVLRCSF